MSSVLLAFVFTTLFNCCWWC